MNRSLSAFLLAPLALSGCATMEPHYTRPESAVASALPTGPSYPAPGTSAAWSTIGWQEFFTDPRLKKVIATALYNNRDLRIAIANIESARAQYRIQRADLVPQIDGSASATYGSASANTDSTGAAGTATGGGATAAGASGAHANERQYSASAGVTSYELDIWGRIRSLTEEALEKYLATEETRRATQISLISDTATAWLNLASDQSQLAVAQETYRSGEESLLLTKKRLAAGIASDLDVQQAQTLAQQALAQIGQSTTAVAQDENALRLLVGAPVSPDMLPTSLDDHITNRETLPADLSSTVLFSRPDVLSAEHDLRAANFDIGAARAAFFPTISLTGSGGVSSIQLSSLFSGGSLNWNFTPAISLPFLDGGKLRAQLAQSKAEKSVQVATYEKTAQTAFREIADALAQRGTIDRQVAADAAVVASAQRSLQLSAKRYRAGIDTYLDVLDSQRTLFSAQQTLVTIRQTRAANLVTLYKALGGGIV